MTRDLWDQLHAGDWACAEGDAEALARVAGSLGHTLQAGQGAVARHVARLAASDLDSATLLWGRLVRNLRADLGPDTRC